jgi:GT2 family glycosyltransferase
MSNKSIDQIAVVVLNWNGIKDTITCLDSLLLQTFPHYKIIVIDNGSSDNSLDQLKKYAIDHEDYQIELICNNKNLGFAGGVNTGIRWALENNFDAIALFNNDATADKNWLSNLVKGLDNQEVGISTGLLLHENGKTIDSTGEFYSKWGLSFPRNRGENTVFANVNSMVFGATGGATLYRSTMLKEIGLFDDDFFAYYEDADISFRAQLAGWKVAYNSEAIAYHKQGATSSKIPGFAVYQTFKNLPVLFLKNVPKELLLFIGCRFYLAYALMYFNTFTHGTGWPATKGLFKSLVLTPKALKERSVIQHNKKVSTDYIKSILWDDLPPDQTGLRKLRKFFIKK